MRSMYSSPFRNSLSFANHQFFFSLFSGRLHPPRICHGSQILSNACQELAAQFRIARGWLVSVFQNLYLSSVYTRLLSLLTLIAMFFFQEYLFNPKVLIPNGPPPNDRGCIICGKIGHKAKECEWRRGGANRNKNKGNNNDRQPDNRSRQQQQQRSLLRQPEQQIQNPRAAQLQQHINQERAAYHQQQQNHYRPAQQRPVNDFQNRQRQPQLNVRQGPQANSNLVIRERIVTPSVRREVEGPQQPRTN